MSSLSFTLEVKGYSVRLNSPNHTLTKQSHGMENSNIEGVTTDGKRKHSKFKYCIVPQCPSTTIKWPDKLFISLPRNPNTRNLWQKAMKREVFLGPKTNKYVCEDHFNLEEDLANYQYYKLMGKGSGYVKMKPEIVPHIFNCQKDTVVKPTTSRGPVEKGKRRENVSKATKKHEKNTKLEEQDAEKLGSENNADILKKEQLLQQLKTNVFKLILKRKQCQSLLNLLKLEHKLLHCV